MRLCYTEQEMMTDIGDIIEIVTDIPKKNLRVGMRGAVVHCHSNDFYEIEFTDENGETLDFSALHAKHFIVVWRAETRQWVSIAEQTSAQLQKQIGKICLEQGYEMPIICTPQELMGE